MIVTDESLELTSGGDGTPGNPIRCIRGAFDCWEDMERWLEAEYNAAIAEGWL